jgi:hypothetical protein
MIGAGVREGEGCIRIPVAWAGLIANRYGCLWHRGIHVCPMCDLGHVYDDSDGWTLFSFC